MPAPTITARMAATIDSISHGRFGINLVTGRPGGVLLVFDYFLKGLDEFGTRIQPLMRTRRHITVEAPLAEVA